MRSGKNWKRCAGLNTVLKKSFVDIAYTSDDLVAQIFRSLANIGQHIGNLRNDISPTSHDKSLGELKERNSKVDELLIRSLNSAYRFSPSPCGRGLDEGQAAQQRLFSSTACSRRGLPPSSLEACHSPAGR